MIKKTKNNKTSRNNIDLKQNPNKEEIFQDHDPVQKIANF